LERMRLVGEGQMEKLGGGGGGCKGKRKTKKSGRLTTKWREKKKTSILPTLERSEW